MDPLFETYLEASDGMDGSTKGILAVRNYVLKESNKKYDNLVALIWHKIGNGEDGATPIEKLISDFSDEHYKLFNTFRDCEATIVDLTEKYDRVERALKRVGFQDLGGQEWKPPLGKAPRFDLTEQAIRNAWLDAEAGGGNSWDGAKAVLDLINKKPFVEKCPKCFDTGTAGDPAQACDCKKEISTGKAFQMEPVEPGTMTQDEALGVVMASVDQVETLARVLGAAYSSWLGAEPRSTDEPIGDSYLAEARAAIAHLSKRPGLTRAEAEAKWKELIPDRSIEHDRFAQWLLPLLPVGKRLEGLPTRDDLYKGWLELDHYWDGGAEIEKLVIDHCLFALRPWLRDPVGCELDVTAEEAAMAYKENVGGDGLLYGGLCAMLALCRSRIRPVYECDCSAIEKERDLLKVEYESRQIIINNIRAALEGRPFKNTLEGE